MDRTEPCVLIVEDNADLRSLFKRALRLAGYKTCEATNGREALDSFENSDLRPSLIVLDLMMPVMDGWEFLQEREKSEACARVPVVVCSAADEVPDGFHVLRKPVDPDALIEAVEEYCGKGARDAERA